VKQEFIKLSSKLFIFFECSQAPEIHPEGRFLGEEIMLASVDELAFN
jgi:hypothetical protein